MRRYIKNVMSDDRLVDVTVVRKMNERDDFGAVARLIYNSDKYIYPYLFDGDVKAGEKALLEMIRGDTLYNYRNIRVAECDRKILGMAVMNSVPPKVGLNEIVNCFLRAGLIVGERFAKVYSEYYKLLEDEPPDIYIANLCVDKAFRGLGVAKKLLTATLDDKLTYHLECVKDNVSALKLYEQSGFEIDYEYPGFTEVPCYRMTRKATEGE